MGNRRGAIYCARYFNPLFWPHVLTTCSFVPDSHDLECIFCFDINWVFTITGFPFTNISVIWAGWAGAIYCAPTGYMITAYILIQDMLWVITVFGIGGPFWWIEQNVLADIAQISFVTDNVFIKISLPCKFGSPILPARPGNRRLKRSDYVSDRPRHWLPSAFKALNLISICHDSSGHNP